MTEQDFNRICLRAIDVLRETTPIRTGNLRYNSVNFAFFSANNCHIWVDEAIAPYMPYTNEPWIAKRWHGKKNPNEGWWQYGVRTVAETLTKEFGGTLREI